MGYNGTDNHSEQYIVDLNSAYGFLYLTDLSGIAIPDVQEVEVYHLAAALSARQVMGVYVFAMPPNSGSLESSTNTSKLLVSPKKISSDGNVSTVDVMHPANAVIFILEPKPS